MTKRCDHYPHQPIHPLSLFSGNISSFMPFISFCVKCLMTQRVRINNLIHFFFPRSNFPLIVYLILLEFIFFHSPQSSQLKLNKMQKGIQSQVCTTQY